jgi:hypothetical protein
MENGSPSGVLLLHGMAHPLHCFSYIDYLDGDPLSGYFRCHCAMAPLLARIALAIPG